MAFVNANLPNAIGVNVSMNVSLDSTEEEFSLIYVLQGFIIFLFALVIIATNILNVIVIPRLPDINEASKVFYICLSTADLILGVVLLPALPAAVVGNWPFGDVICKIFGFFMSLVAGISSVSLLLLNLDRFFTISSPFRYIATMNRRKAFIISFCLIIAEALLLVVFTFVNPLGVEIIQYSPRGGCIMSFDKPAFLPYSFVTFSLCIWSFIPILTIMYTRIICISRNHVRRIQVQELTTCHSKMSTFDTMEKDQPKNNKEKNPPKNAKTKPNKSSAASHRALKMTLLVTGSYVLAWAPFTICQVYVAMIYPADVSEIIRSVVCWPLLFNPLCNIIIYSVTKRSYRTCARNILKSCTKCSLTDFRNASSN